MHNLYTPYTRHYYLRVLVRLTLDLVNIKSVSSQQSFIWLHNELSHQTTITGKSLTIGSSWADAIFMCSVHKHCMILCIWLSAKVTLGSEVKLLILTLHDSIEWTSSWYYTYSGPCCGCSNMWWTLVLFILSRTNTDLGKSHLDTAGTKRSMFVIGFSRRLALSFYDILPIF